MKKDKIEQFKNSLFEYDDYRVFLQDFFSLQKKLKTTFTQRYFAKKAGFNSHAFCNYVINGKRNLSSKTIFKFTDALGLNKIKSRYFELLVNFNQTESQSEKEHFFEELQRIKKRCKFTSVSTKQQDYFTKGYYAIVRELAVHAHWQGDFEKLAKMVIPEITAKQAEDAIEMMIESSILKEKNSVYSFGKENIDDSNVPMFLKKKARREVFASALDSLESTNPNDRFAAYSTFSTDKGTYEKINELYKEFKKEAFKLVMDSPSKDDVYQIAFTNRPVSKTDKE